MFVIEECMPCHMLCQKELLHIENFIMPISHRQLFLDSNNIQFIEQGAFRTTVSLEFLSLYDNKLGLGAFPTGVFMPLNMLIYLDLSQNKIPSLEGGMTRGLHNVRYFNYAHNPVENVACGTFNNFGSGLNYLNGTGAPADCSINFETTYPQIRCACPNSANGAAQCDDNCM